MNHAENGAHGYRAGASERGRILVRARLYPYKAGVGPSFSLTVWRQNRATLGYRLTMSLPREGGAKTEPVTVFAGTDYRCREGRLPDHDKRTWIVRGVMGWLIDPEIGVGRVMPGTGPVSLGILFGEHAEELWFEVERRFPL